MISKLSSLNFPLIAGQLTVMLPSLQTFQAFVAYDKYGQLKGRVQDICVVQMDGWER